MYYGTEIFKGAVLYENKGLFSGKRNNTVSYYSGPTIDGKQLKAVAFALKSGLCHISPAPFYSTAISARCQAIKGYFVSSIFSTSSEKQTAMSCCSPFCC